MEGRNCKNFVQDGDDGHLLHNYVTGLCWGGAVTLQMRRVIMPVF